MEGLNQAADLGRGAGGSRGEEIRIRNILLGTEGEQEGDEPVDHPAHEDGEPDGGVQEEEQEGVEKGRHHHGVLEQGLQQGRVFSVEG